MQSFRFFQKYNPLPRAKLLGDINRRSEVVIHEATRTAYIFYFHFPPFSKYFLGRAIEYTEILYWFLRSKNGLGFREKRTANAKYFLDALNKYGKVILLIQFTMLQFSWLREIPPLFCLSAICLFIVCSFYFFYLKIRKSNEMCLLVASK